MSIFSPTDLQLLNKLFSITSKFKIYARKPEKSKYLYADDYLQALSNYGIDFKKYDKICHKPVRNGMVFMFNHEDLYNRLLTIGVIRVKNIIVELIEEEKFFSCCKVLFKGVNPLWTDENIKDFICIFKTPYSNYRKISSDTIKSPSDKLLVGFNYAPKILVELTPKGKKIIIDKNTNVKFQWMLISTCLQCNCIGHNEYLCPHNPKYLANSNILNNSLCNSPTNNKLTAVEFLLKNWPIDIIIPTVSDVDGDVVVGDYPDDQCSANESDGYSECDSDFSTGSMDLNDFINLDYNSYRQRLRSQRKRKK